MKHIKVLTEKEGPAMAEEETALDKIGEAFNKLIGTKSTP